jgi:hypothetical protein
MELRALKRSSLLIGTIALLSQIVQGRAVAANVCPPVGADTDCGTIITVSDTGTKVTHTGQGPYDSIEDTLVGVVNNSKQPIAKLGLRSAQTVFGFDGDGIDTYGVAGNSSDSTGYGGPNAYFTDIDPSTTSGTVNFITPIAPGKTAFFSLEEKIQSACSCGDVLNNAIQTTLGGPVSLDGKNTSISATFTPQCGGTGGSPPTLQQAAAFCGFVEFDWQQTFTFDPPPETTCEAGSTTPLTAPPSYNDPPPKGWDYQHPPNAVILPVYYNLFTPATDPYSVAANEEPTQDLATSTSLSFYDAPGDFCLPGQQSASVAAAADAVCGAPCGSTISGSHKRAPPNSYMGITTRLVGIVGSLPGASIQDTGMGFVWTSTFNGTTGGISIKSSTQPVDPGSGSGGVTITKVINTTTYSYDGITVTTVNGQPVSVDQTPPVITASANPASLWPPNNKMVPVTVSGTMTDNGPGDTGLNPSSAVFTVVDEYGAVQPSGPITPGADGSYSFVVNLQVSRTGTDLDGRHYTITVNAQDKAGNQATAVTIVVVPHDQGK